MLHDLIDLFQQKLRQAVTLVLGFLQISWCIQNFALDTNKKKCALKSYIFDLLVIILQILNYQKESFFYQHPLVAIFSTPETKNGCETNYVGKKRVPINFILRLTV